MLSFLFFNKINAVYKKAWPFCHIIVDIHKKMCSQMNRCYNQSWQYHVNLMWTNKKSTMKPSLHLFMGPPWSDRLYIKQWTFLWSLILKATKK